MGNVNFVDAKIEHRTLFIKVQRAAISVVFSLLLNLLAVATSFGQIANNHIDFTNGLHGTLCVTQAEADPGPSPYAALTAPAGTVFTTVNFASYGSPTGTCGSFYIGSCHAATSQSVVEAYLLGKGGTINIPPSNGTFGDPCVGTLKQLYISVNYTEPICAGTSPGAISGTTPTGGTLGYTYAWESSTTSSSFGFSTISGKTGKNYNPGNLSATTWFRRKVTSGNGLIGYSDILQVTVVANPGSFSVTGGGAFCNGGAGVAIGLNNSASGVSYQLMLGTTSIGTPVSGTGSAISFGNQTVAGTYTVMATNTTGCSQIMTGNAKITVNTLPAAYPVTGGGSYCSGGAGVAIGLSNSALGVSYQLMLGTISIGTPLAGTGSAVTFGNQTAAGTYTVVATNSSCSQTMTGSAIISVNTLPAAYQVTGGGSYCSGGSGVVIGVNNSSSGVSYQLMLGATSIGTPVSGNGSAISFGNQTGAGTYTVIATNTSGCSKTMTGSAIVTINALASVSTSVAPSCIGGSSGSIMVIASGGQAPYTYSINSGTYQTSNVFTALAAASYSIAVKTNVGCISTTTATISAFGNSTDDQSAAATDTWVGHLYKGMNFENYIGHFNEAEIFDEGFGGDYNCFSVSSGSLFPTIYTEQFSVRFRMNSTRKGLYVVDLGSDDGSRLTIDGTMIYNNWVDQSFTLRPGVLMSLNGGSALNYEFYENAINNRVVFQNLIRIFGNSLSGNLSQSVCIGTSGQSISGDIYGTLPAGITKSGTGYQWSYSTSPGGPRTNIAGATADSYIPNTSIAPFNVAGTFYIYRNAILNSTNNTGVGTYTATNESNPATLTVNPASVGGTINSNATVCLGANSGTLTLSGYAGSILRWESSINGGSAWIAISNTTNSLSYTNLSLTTQYRAVIQNGLCTVANSASALITVTPPPSATISYPGSPFCINGGTISATRTGTAGGTYSSSLGLSISSSGTIDLNSSTPSTYTVAYTIAAAGGCAAYSTTASITIKPNPGTPVFTLGATSSRCQGTGSVLYSATSTNSVSIGYSLDAASIAGGNTINSSDGTVNYAAGWIGNSIITATATGCNAPVTASHTVTINGNPSVTYSTTATCIGGSSGSITLSAGGGVSPYTFSLNSGAYQSSNLFSGLAAGSYSVSIKSNTACTTSTTIVISPYANSTDDQNAAGLNSWTGHMYSGINFANYVGHFTEAESFDESFGGGTNCFNISSGAFISSIFTEKFSVKFKMNSSRKGLYVADLGSDDGARLTVDGNLIYNDWTDHSVSSNARVLMNLTGNSSLLYEYYENAGLNQVVFKNMTLVLANSLTVNTNQIICLGSAGTSISGDAFGVLPAGLSGGQYQWTYSTTPGGLRTIIAGAVASTFTPTAAAAPFNVTGTFYIYRNAKVSSTNNVGVNPYVAINESNAAVITVNAPPSASVFYPRSSYCTSGVSVTVTLSGTGGGTYTSTAGLSIDALTGTITPSASTAGSYVVTYTMAASGGCSLKTATTNVIIAIPGSWTGAVSSNWSDAGNWLCGQIPTSVIDVIVPSGLSNYPVVVATGVSNNVSIGSGASLTVSGGTLQVYGAISSPGQINALNGTIEMKGPSGQGISGSMFYNKTIKNLLISNNGQLAISSAVGDTLKIGGTLSFGNSSGTLHTGDNLTLLSGATSTAAVGKLGTGNSISGKVVVERYINTGTGVGQHGKTWEFLSTPTMGQSIKESWMEGSAPSGDSHPGYGTQVTGPAGPAAGFDLASATASVKYYNSSTEGWTGAVNANDAVYNKKGYMVFVRGDRSVNGTTIKTATPTTLRTKGELFTGPQAPIAVAKDKYESIGNPYAAPIDFTQISREAGIDNKFYTWDPYLYGSYGLGGYQTLSSVTNWEPVPGGTKIYPSGIPKSTIRSGQAFLVHSTGIGPASYDLTITENSKVTSNASSETARPNGASPSTGRQFFSVSLYSGSDQSALIADGNTVAFSRSFSNAIDGDDALKLQNSGENFGLKRSGKILAIEARGPVSETDTLYYNMSNLKQQAYQLRFAPGNMESMGLSAYLSDRYLNTTTPISLSDTSVVNITVTSAAASSSADRFSVIFKQMAALPVTYTSVKAYEKGSDIVVAWTVENEAGMQEYQIESSGDGNSFKKAAIVTAANRGSGSYEWLDRNVAAGNHYYRIKSIDKNGKSAYTQVVKVLTGQEARSITVYPNPVINQSIHLQLTNQPEGVYVVRLTDNRGQVILTRKINHAAGTSTEQLQCDHTLAKGIYNLEITTPTGEVKVIKVMISNL